MYDIPGIIAAGVLAFKGGAVGRYSSWMGIFLREGRPGM
jgi:hypothetical protein